jgi:hypothetical protein
VTARELPPDEGEQIIPKVIAIGSGFAEFQANTRRRLRLGVGRSATH